MKKFVMVCAAALVSLGLVSSAAASTVSTLDFSSDTDPSNQVYAQDGYVMTQVGGGNLSTPNNCGSDCLLLQNTNSAKIYKLQRSDGGLFDLVRFSYLGTSNNNDEALRVSTTLAQAEADTGELFSESFVPATQLATTPDLTNYQGVSMIFFRSTDTGSARIDDIVVRSEDPSPVPLPAAGFLLLGGLGALGLMRRRKTA